jgi:FlaA1/EpsC-like NDP-sugar epimerase
MNRPDDWVERVLGRAERPIPLETLVPALRGRGGPVLITGAGGSLGGAIADLLDEYGVEFVGTDLAEMDVTDRVQVELVMRSVRPSTVLHLAGAKHAPVGEEDPRVPSRVHIDGTANVLRYVPAGSVVVTASTCKACDPETAYGASKLVAERLTLNAGQRVARFHNVVETSGNVFDIWERQTRRVVSAECYRYFISRAEALGVLLFAAVAPPGRYIAPPGMRRSMRDVHEALYPGAAHVVVPPRRGDRISEPLTAHSESIHGAGSPGIARITSPHDAVVGEAA